MDAVSLQGVFMSFPQIVASGRVGFAAGILHRMLSRQRNFVRWQQWEDVPERLRRRLLDRTIESLATHDDDDLFLILAV